MQLYALCDAATLQAKGVTLETFVEYARKHDASIIQYRNKEDDTATVKANLLKLRALWDKKLLINDFIELVTFCDGLHIGQDDLRKLSPSIEEIIPVLRSHVTPEKLLGISTHNEEEITIANGLDVDYIGLGAYRATSTKEVDNILGDDLDRLAKLSKHPVAAIGGIRFEDHFDHVTYKVMGSALYED